MVNQFKLLHSNPEAFPRALSLGPREGCSQLRYGFKIAIQSLQSQTTTPNMGSFLYLSLSEEEVGSIPTRLESAYSPKSSPEEGLNSSSSCHGRVP